MRALINKILSFFRRNRAVTPTTPMQGRRIGQNKYDHNLIADLYEAGHSTKQVAALVGCSPGVVSTVANRRGIIRRAGRPNKVRQI